jgi:single-stranded DNA-binding protein
MNIVEIIGIVSHVPIERELASGDKSLNWRVKVQREESGSDSIPCTISFDRTSKSLLNRVINLEVGSSVEICGKLRSRFWQGSGGSSSRLEVEVTSIKKIAKKALSLSD